MGAVNPSLFGRNLVVTAIESYEIAIPFLCDLIYNGTVASRLILIIFSEVARIAEWYGNVGFPTMLIDLHFRGVPPSNRLMGLCRWMGSHFLYWIDYNAGWHFFIELLQWGRSFSGFFG